MTAQQTMISALLDILIDNIERTRERLDYLLSLKAQLERLILDEKEGSDGQ